MSGIENLDELLTSMEPSLREGEFAFLTFPGQVYGAQPQLNPVASFAEREGLTLVVPVERAEAAQIDFDGAYRMISLNVHSSLSAVGLTAAVAVALTEKGISANVVAAYYHDHIFVPANRAEQALAALKVLSSESQS